MKFLQWTSAQRIYTSIFHISLNDFVIFEISYMFRILVQNFLFRINVQNSEWIMRYFKLSLNDYTENYVQNSCSEFMFRILVQNFLFRIHVQNSEWKIRYSTLSLNNYILCEIFAMDKCTKNQHFDISH